MRGVVLACALGLAGCAGDDPLEEPVDTGIVFEASTVEDVNVVDSSDDTADDDTGLSFDSTTGDADASHTDGDADGEADAGSETASDAADAASDAADAASDAPGDAPATDAADALTLDVALDVTLPG
jgi:hypothetical protein